MSKHYMKKFSVIPLIAALAVFVSCQKQQTEEERKAEVERQVQDRLAAERMAADKDQLARQQAELDAREKALAERETARTPAEPPTQTTSERVIADTAETETRTDRRSTAAYGMFYEKLDPYGEWRETSEYGFVWQPREAETSRDWRPYVEGRWVYSDAGWTWVSDEKFGWATYHYGRWVRLRRVGWVWVPGEEWAPAWVSWRTSKDYVGWAPLPPEARFDRRSGIQNWADSYYDIGPDQYSFVSSNDFGGEHLRRSVVPAERNINIVIETTNVTRITFANTTIMNEGPSYDELRSRSQRPIERYRLRRERNTEGPPRIAGNELEVSVPLLSEVQNIVRPRHVKERVTDVNVDNGWTSVSDRSAVERARSKIRGEATPPPNAPPRKFVPPTQTVPTTTASASPAATVATTPAPTATIAPSSAATATTAPVHSATSTPAPTAAATASAAPAASVTPRVRPSPTSRPARPSATPAPTAASVATAMPAASATPTPASTVAPIASPSASIPARVLPVPTPQISRPATTPPSSPGRTAAPRPVLPVPPVTPETSDTTRQPGPRDIPRRTMPPRFTPAPAATTPASETAATTTPLVPRDVPRRTPPQRVIPPAATPRFTPPPAATTPASETAATMTPPVPRDIPRRTPPQRMIPPAVTTPVPAPATTPSIAPSSPAAADDRGKNRRPPRPVPGATETGTPTPVPSTPPN